MTDFMQPYPVIMRTKERSSNSSGRCKCGKAGRYWIFIDCILLATDDVWVWACEDHKKDVNYLYYGEDD